MAPAAAWAGKQGGWHRATASRPSGKRTAQQNLKVHRETSEPIPPPAPRRPSIPTASQESQRRPVLPSLHFQSLPPARSVSGATLNSPALNQVPFPRVSSNSSSRVTSLMLRSRDTFQIPLRPPVSAPPVPLALASACPSGCPFPEVPLSLLASHIPVSPGGVCPYCFSHARSLNGPTPPSFSSAATNVQLHFAKIRKGLRTEPGTEEGPRTRQPALLHRPPECHLRVQWPLGHLHLNIAKTHHIQT